MAMDWIDVVKDVKVAIAEKNVSYSQIKYTTITVNGKSESVRQDCSGYVSSCLYFYNQVFKKGYMTTSYGFSKSKEVNTLLTKAKFKKMNFTSWDKLQEGDIITQANAHVEIFSHNLNGKHYVYSNGSTSSVRSKVPTPDGGRHKYDTVWRLTTEGATDHYTKEDFFKDIQAGLGVKVDGIPKDGTLSHTITVSATKNNKHIIVRALQKRLYVLGFTSVGKPDGDAGKLFTKAVKEYQKKYLKLEEPDGEITAKCGTWKSLLEIK